MNGHDFAREQNMEARIRLVAARRELADAVNDATIGIGCLTCDDPQTMNHIRAYWKRIYDRYLETDSLIADLVACARNIMDGGEWNPSELATESKPFDIVEGCACFAAETPDRVLIIPSEPTPIPNLPGVWMDKDGNLLAVSGERRVRIWNNHDWMAEELDDDSGEPSAHGPYTRYSLQTVEEVPWKPESGDSTPIHEGTRTVHLPDVRSFGRLEQDKWLAVKNLEESAELVEACKQYLKACDPTDPSGIGREFDDHANCLACYGVNVGGELGDDRDKAKTGWIGHVRDQRRQAMLDELADVLQTVGNLITAFGITDEEVERAMDDCLERNRRKGRL